VSFTAEPGVHQTGANHRSRVHYTIGPLTDPAAQQKSRFRKTEAAVQPESG
jgi:hypothetical protein